MNGIVVNRRQARKLFRRLQRQGGLPPGYQTLLCQLHALLNRKDWQRFLLSAPSREFLTTRGAIIGGVQ